MSTGDREQITLARQPEVYAIDLRSIERSTVPRVVSAAHPVTYQVVPDSVTWLLRRSDLSSCPTVGAETREDKSLVQFAST